MFRKKRLLKKIVVHFDNHDGQSFTKTIEIPDGWKFEHKFAGHPCMIDEDGAVQRLFEWRAGFTIEYEYIYEVREK